MFYFHIIHVYFYDLIILKTFIWDKIITQILEHKNCETITATSMVHLSHRLESLLCVY